MEKAFYPRNDMVNGVVGNLLPRDGKEDILPDQNGDPIYLQRSSILDGTEIRGFGYCDGHPYKWKVEIESGLKSLCVVPDRFFSIYGKSYPIKRKQTVAINQASESYKYEIIYLRGYDKYDDEGYTAKIIYHRQQEENLKPMVCSSDEQAIDLLNQFDNYPYLKLRVCMDGSIRAYLGAKEVGWDYTRQIDDEVAVADENKYWIEIPQINTEQFRDIDLWVQFDSINALSYYLITKYEENIFEIGPKNITGGFVKKAEPTEVIGYKIDPSIFAESDQISITLKAGAKYQTKLSEDAEWSTITVPLGDTATLIINRGTFINETYYFTDVNEIANQLSLIKSIRNPRQYYIESQVENYTYYNFSLVDVDDVDEIILPTTIEEVSGQIVDDVVGKDYSLITPADLDESDSCTPCCKKSNLSRSIWAYINPRTMTPYDDDYWFHQGEPYYKKSLTLSTKNNPLKAQRIFVEQGTFPGMYKIVGETYIRNRDTGKDERVQLTFPLCKIKSDQTLTLQADGDPTTFNLDVEVAVPQNGIPMEITFYEVEKEMKAGCGDAMVEKDGSTRISAG